MSSVYTIEQVTKDPNDVLNYEFDFTPWLNGDTISAVTWTLASGITEVSSSFTTTTATVIISGGTIGQTYNVTCQITTVASLVKNRTFALLIQKQ